MTKLVLLMFLVGACAAEAPTVGEVADDLQTDWCDPYYQPSCGVIVLYDGGIANVGASMLDAIDESGGTATLTACSGGGTSTTCTAALVNGYRVSCRLEDPQHIMVTCAFTAPH